MKLNYKFSNLVGITYKQGNIVFTPDGKGLFSPVGRRVTYFDLSGGTESETNTVTLPFEFENSIQHLAISPDGVLLMATDGRGHGVLCNVPRRVVLHHFSWKDDPINLVSFSPDGRFLATTGAGGDLRVRLWHTPRPDTWAFAPLSLDRVFTGHSAPIVSLEWSNDSRYLITASQDMTARIYDISKDELNPRFKVLELRAHRHPLVGAFFGAGNQRVYTIGRNGSVFTWRFHPNKGILLEMEPYRRNHIKTTAITPEQEAKYAQDKIEEEDPSTLEKENEEVTFKSKIVAISYCSSSKLLVTAFANGLFCIHRLDPWFETIYSLGLFQGHISTLAINSSGNWIALGGTGTGIGTGTETETKGNDNLYSLNNGQVAGQLLVWDWSNENFIFKQLGHPGPLQCLAYSSDGQTMATGSVNGKVKLWSTLTGLCFTTFSEHSAAVSALHFARQGKILISASNDGTVRAYDLLRFRNFRTFTTPKPVQFLSLAIDPSGEVVAAGTLDTFEIYLWSMASGQLLDVIAGHRGPISDLAFEPNSGRVLASASWDRTVRLWEVFQRDMNPQELTHSSDVLALAFRTPDGQELAAVTLAGQIVTWRVDLAEISAIYDCRRDLALRPLDPATIKSITYSPDGSYIMVAGTFPFIALYNAESRVLVKRYWLHERRQSNDNDDTTVVKAIRMSPTGRAFVALTEKGLIMFSQDEQLIFDPFDLQVDLTPDKVRLILSQEQDYLKAWIMAHRLNISEVLLEVWNNIPIAAIPGLSRDLPRKYLHPTLSFLAGLINGTTQLERLLRWITAILKEHILSIRGEKSRYGIIMQRLERALKNLYEDYRKLAMETVQSLEVAQFRLNQMDSSTLALNNSSLDICLHAIEQ